MSGQKNQDNKILMYSESEHRHITQVILSLIDVCKQTTNEDFYKDINFIPHSDNEILYDYDDEVSKNAVTKLARIYMDHSRTVKNSPRDSVKLLDVAEENLAYQEYIAPIFIDSAMALLEEMTESIPFTEISGSKGIDQDELESIIINVLKNWKNSVRLFFDPANIYLQYKYDKETKSLVVNINSKNGLENDINELELHLPNSPLYAHGVLQWENRVKYFKALKTENLYTPKLPETLQKI